MRHYNRFYAFNNGPFAHLVMRRTLALHLGEVDPIPPPPDDPIPPPPPDPIPPPEPDPVPPPEPEPIPPPPDDPIPPPPPDDYDFDEIHYPGFVVLVNAKHAQSHKGLWWFKVDDGILDAWALASERHLDDYLHHHGQERRACYVFCLSKTGGWWEIVRDYVIRRGGIVVED